MKNNAATGAIITLIAFAILGVAFFTSTRFAAATDQSGNPAADETNVPAGFSVNTRSQLVATHTIEYIEKTVVDVEYVEQIREIPVKLRNFSDIDELNRWLESKTTLTTVLFQYPDAVIDCDDYALTMQQRAFADGYIMSFQIIEHEKYNSLFINSKLESDELHAINLVIIGNEIYYLEPQTGETAFVSYLD